MGELAQTIEDLRAICVDSLCDLLEDRLKKSERELAGAWSKSLYSDPTILDSGWYVPPHMGTILTFSDEPPFERANIASFRPEESWPSEHVLCTNESVVTAYTSPVDKDSGLIGDSGVTLYGGSQRSIYQHLTDCLTLAYEIVDGIQPGDVFGDVYSRAIKTIERAGYINEIVSPNDSTNTNIGHTIPWTTEGSQFPDVIVGGNVNEVASVIGNARTFVNATSDYVIPETGAFSIEPRLGKPNMPAGFYHLVVVFEQGEKTVISGYETLFDLFDMSMPEYRV